MSVQQHLPFGAPPSPPEANQQRSAATVRVQPADAAGVPAPVWLQRMSLIVLVLFCLYLGLLITLLPWWPRMWDGNELLIGHPALRRLLMQGWARGAVSGLGLLDLWIGISELIHYRDYRR